MNFLEQFIVNCSMGYRNNKYYKVIAFKIKCNYLKINYCLNFLFSCLFQFSYPLLESFLWIAKVNKNYCSYVDVDLFHFSYYVYIHHQDRSFYFIYLLCFCCPTFFFFLFFQSLYQSILK